MARSEVDGRNDGMPATKEARGRAAEDATDDEQQRRMATLPPRFMSVEEVEGVMEREEVCKKNRAA